MQPQLFNARYRYDPGHLHSYSLMAEAFTSIPVLDWTQVSTDREQFLHELRHALIHVGFLYLKHPPVTPQTRAAFIDYIPRLFDLPQEEKDALIMRNNAHFLGYTSLGREFTKGKEDQREQFDFGTPYINKWKPHDPYYRKLWGASQVRERFSRNNSNISQWPEEASIPGFRAAYEQYLHEVEVLSFEFIKLMNEALGLPSGILDQFFEAGANMQHRSKVLDFL